VICSALTFDICLLGAVAFVFCLVVVWCAWCVHNSLPVVSMATLMVTLHWGRSWCSKRKCPCFGALKTMVGLETGGVAGGNRCPYSTSRVGGRIHCGSLRRLNHQASTGACAVTLVWSISHPHVPVDLILLFSFLGDHRWSALRPQGCNRHAQNRSTASTLCFRTAHGCALWRWLVCASNVLSH